MLPDKLPQLIDTLLRLPHLEAAQLQEVIQHLPNPQASAQEMLDRGWITPDQYSSLFPAAPASTLRETVLDGVGADQNPSDGDGDEDWGLALIEEEDKADTDP